VIIEVYIFYRETLQVYKIFLERRGIILGYYLVLGVRTTLIRRETGYYIVWVSLVNILEKAWGGFY